MNTAAAQPTGNLSNRVNPWLAGGILLAMLVVLPVVCVLTLAFSPTENIWPHLYSTVLSGYLWHTFGLMLGVSIGVLFIGVSTAWLVTMCRFPGRRYFTWLLLLPLAVPAYVVAYVYTDLLEFAGPVQSALREVFGWETKRDYWFPSIRTLGGAVLMMGLVLYPYVYLLARASFLEQSVKTMEASRVLGRNAWQSFFSVSLPMARPAIAVGVALALMETLNDFGTVDYFAVRTLTAGLYDVWLGMSNLGGAAQIAAVMLAFVVLLITLERIGRRSQRYYQSENRLQDLPEYVLHGRRKWLAFTVCLLPVMAGFVLPALVLLKYSMVYFEKSWTPEFREYALNSIVLSTVAALLASVLAIIIAYARRLSTGKGVQFVTRLSLLGYAVPGAVLAIGIIVPFAAFDNALDAFMRETFGISTGLILSGSVFAIIFAYTVRFLAVSQGSVESSLSKITPGMDMAARTLGHTAGQTLLRYHLPLIRGGVLTGALVVFVDCMKELPATLILRPFNFDTLATNVYEFASDELIEQASLGSLVIVVSGLIPVVLLSKTISKSRQVKY